MIEKVSISSVNKKNTPKKSITEKDVESMPGHISEKKTDMPII